MGRRNAKRSANETDEWNVTRRRIDIDEFAGRSLTVVEDALDEEEADDALDSLNVFDDVLVEASVGWGNEKRGPCTSMRSPCSIRTSCS